MPRWLTQRPVLTTAKMMHTDMDTDMGTMMDTDTVMDMDTMTDTDTMKDTDTDMDTIDKGVMRTATDTDTNTNTNIEVEVAMKRPSTRHEGCS